jgi:LDH2 family malate/lactate/ureidoglycolate dehydrogenase
MTASRYIQAEPLRRFCAAAFEGVGMADDDAATVADTLVEADLRGVHSHGVWWLITYTQRVRHGGINPQPDIRIVRETPVMVVIDADRAIGQVASVAAMRQAIHKAKACGVGVAAVRNSNHFGAAAYYALMAAQEGQIGFAVSDAEPSMAPWGGARAVVGNNPMAYAVPAGADYFIVLDMAQSVVAWGKIFLAAQRGEKIPSTWALNPAGEPTDDPHAAMAGLLLPFGGYKGYGLAVIMEILSSVLVGATFGLGVPPMTDLTAGQDVGHFFMALDIEHFLPQAEFQQRITTLLNEHRGVPLAPGVERVYLPGEIEHLKRVERLQSGIPLEPYVVEALIGLGEEMGLDTHVLRGG